MTGRARSTRRYAAFLRGVMPMNCSMAGLRLAFEQAGFTNVKTVLGSGNVVFDARPTTAAALEKRAEAAMDRQLGRRFLTIVRPVAALQRLLATDPYAPSRPRPGAKRFVTFLRAKPRTRIALPVALENARIVAQEDREVFTSVVRVPGNAAFMVLIEKTYGKDLTTRTWETVEKVVRA